VNYLQGLAAARCLQQEGLGVDNPVHALSATSPRPPTLGKPGWCHVAGLHKGTGVQRRLHF